jgi:hypothetical protein
VLTLNQSAHTSRSYAAKKLLAAPCLQQKPPCPGWCPTWKHFFANIFLADMRGAGKIAQDFAASEGAQREAKRLSAV